MTNEHDNEHAAVSDEMRELEAYRDKVLHHLREREQRMHDIERELQQILSTLKGCSVQRFACAGNVEKIIASEAHRKNLSSQKTSLKTRLDDARNEVKLARERLDLAEVEIREALEAEALDA